MKIPLPRSSLAAFTATAVCLGSLAIATYAQDTVSNTASNKVNSAAAAPAPALSPGAAEVMKLFKGGISSDIIISYINNSSSLFYLSADNLIALRQADVPPQVLTAMMQRYGDLQRRTATAAPAPAPPQAPAPPPQQTAAAPAQQPPQQYVSPPVQVPAQAAAPQYYSYAPAPPPTVYTYVAPPGYPVYDPYPYYDPFYYPWYPIGGPVVFDIGIGHFGGGGRFGGGGHFGGGRR
jgi:hypothetical protein